MEEAGAKVVVEGAEWVAPDGHRVLHGLSITADRSQITVLAGPSGSGKSTLLRLLNRLAAPSAGVVLLDGVDVSSMDPLALRRRVGMVFQRPTPFPGTVMDNLRAARTGLGDAGAVAALARVGLDAALLDRRADDLSGGEAQRMCIARTLLTEPEVLLMDEPTSSLDPDSRLAIERLARTLADSGIAVVWVTHDLAQVERLADRTWVIVEGRTASGIEATAYLAEREGDA